MKRSILFSLEPLPYFTMEAVKQLVDNEQIPVATIRTALYRWMKDGRLIKLKKGLYMSQRFFELHRSDLDFAPAVSTVLLPQSYVSMEYVLQRNSILAEVTYPVSSITLKQTRVIENKLGTFAFHNIKESLFFGFELSDYFGILVSQAKVTKALFDYLYFRPLKGEERSASFNLAEELRLNIEDFPKKEQEEFAEYVQRSKSRKMEGILRNLKETIWRH
jgi:predicted transcriptional regulator of viral defense system